jgi:hypothetical protein
MRIDMNAGPVLASPNGSLQPFLRSTDIIDWLHPDVSARARRLRGDSTDPLAIARTRFEWVRDEIKHTADYGLTLLRAPHPRSCGMAVGTVTPRVTCLQLFCEQTGFRLACATSA